jgi:hypothetical protein
MDLGADTERVDGVDTDVGDTIGRRFIVRKVLHRVREKITHSAMKVTEVESFAVSIPLKEPAAFATRVVEERDHGIVYIRTENGTEGVGYTLAQTGERKNETAVIRREMPVEGHLSVVESECHVSVRRNDSSAKPF